MGEKRDRERAVAGTSRCAAVGIPADSHHHGRRLQHLIVQQTVTETLSSIDEICATVMAGPDKDRESVQVRGGPCCDR